MYKYFKAISFFVTLLCSCFYAPAQTNDLQYYLQQGESNSPLLKDYQNQIKSGYIDSALIGAAHRPQVLANGQVMIAPTLNGYGYDQAITNGGNYMAIVSASQPIFTKNILKPQYRSIALQNKAIGNTAKIGKLTLNKTITARYITAYAVYRQFLSNQKVYQLLQAQQQLLKKLVLSGIYKQTDYLNLQVALQSRQITLSQLMMRYKRAISTLNYLCGINDTSTTILAEPDISDNDYTGSVNSIFFKQFTLDSLTILNNKALIDTKYKPSLSWFADAGLQASRPDIIYKSFGADFGLNLSIPIYDGKQRKLNDQKLKIEEDTRTHYASFFNKQYDQQKAMLEQQLNGTEKLIVQIKDKLKASQLLIDLDKKLLNTGELRITDYILAINSYLSIKNNLNQAEINSLQVINELNYWNH